MARAPVYFVSHGGPPTMYDTQHPVYPRLQSLGHEIIHKVKPRAIVVFSAHWQSSQPGNNSIEVNGAEHAPLYYDFYGFPAHYYSEKFSNKGSNQLANQIMQILGEAGISSTSTKRGLDHGIFVPFKIMFQPDTNPLDVPVVQVSLFGDENDATAHIRLGAALQSLRDEGVVIIASGMAVHNTGDFRKLRAKGEMKTMGYVPQFDEAMRVAVESTPGEQRNQKMEALLRIKEARAAHPTFEHLIPIHIAVGAAGDDRGKRLWTMEEGGLSWAQYRFGDIPT